mmetsp:Transcript_30814/g.67483  ORF Transcript_30814/g.67483 Transcript_30814/m.67483 type:complete len:353 (+) Transcript_30814:157-1215(+)
MITVQKRRREELLKGWPCSTQYPLLLPVPKRSGSGFSEAAANMASASSAPSCLPHAVLAFRPPSTPPRGLLTPDRGNRPALLWPGNGGTLWHAKLRSNLGQVEVGHATRSKDLLGQLSVVAPFDGERRVQPQLAQSPHQRVDALLGDEGEAEGVDANLDVVVALEDGARLGDKGRLAVVLCQGVEAELLQVVHLDEQLEPLLHLRLGRALGEPALEQLHRGRACSFPGAQALDTGREVEHDLVARVVGAERCDGRAVRRDHHVEDEPAGQPRVVGRVVRRRRQRHSRRHVREDLRPAEHVRGDNLVHVRHRRRLLPMTFVVGPNTHVEAFAVAACGPSPRSIGGGVPSAGSE